MLCGCLAPQYCDRSFGRRIVWKEAYLIGENASRAARQGQTQRAVTSIEVDAAKLGFTMTEHVHITLDRQSEDALSIL